MARRQRFKRMIRSAAAALVGVSASGAAMTADSGGVSASLCAEGGRRFVKVDFGRDAPDDKSRQGPCHVACIPDWKGKKSRQRC